ncbi:uncharacterized protein TM35_000182740 [Trypanosoma theileri]|uniref:Uncharacterized protein n=1 Tax=Trypanosoma theileri TaxID=67003 RepID=A0A1X0NU20_9TRYP|nr:uncharacterized protein TM35_000182740 [Trypanosoma theileri]ORC88217.1 hypothetical protein TM35_000182740 [Trypanosoma theileri]
MFLSANEVSQAAFQEENARRKDFFTLLYVVERRLYSPTNVEWCLMEHCLDEINYKYADFSFLMGFVSAIALRRRKGRSFISRYRLPLYVGLVGYDSGLRTTNPCPSVTFWNSVTLLESPLGETARVLHAPDCFYEVNYRNGNNSNLSTSYLSWLWNSGAFIADSLLLKSLLRYTFDQSSWRQRNNESTVTGLVVNGRFFRWNLFEIRTHKSESSTTYDLKIGLPRFMASLALRRSYRSREMILERSSFGGKLWYSVHFALMRVLGLHGEN